MDDKSAVFIVGVVVVILFTYLVVKSQKRRIREALTKQGATAVDVSWNFLDSDRGVNAYDVEYTDQQGRRCVTRCRVPLADDIFWSKTPEE